MVLDLTEVSVQLCCKRADLVPGICDQAVRLLLQGLHLDHGRPLALQRLHLLPQLLSQIVRKLQAVRQLGEPLAVAEQIVLELVVARLELQQLHLQIGGLGLEPPRLLGDARLQQLLERLRLLVRLADLLVQPLDVALRARDGVVLLLRLVGQAVDATLHLGQRLREVGLVLQPLAVPTAHVLAVALDRDDLLLHLGGHTG
mmetsp:Transcript_112872/g.351849  ORF Transcript_112872/g.351849 Transcript_112872/m.351849 type:complete len:201 (-) Transcript_112872:109-711(-)